MKDTLMKIKKNLEGNNSRVDKPKNQINDLEHKEAKTTSWDKKKKKDSKKKTQGQCKQPLGQLQAFQHSHNRGARRRRERARNWKTI